MLFLKKQYFIIEHRSPAYEQRLRQDIKSLQSRLQALDYSYRQMVIKYGAEVQYNALLCDLLRVNGIPFRHVFDHSSRYLKEDEETIL